MLLFIEEERTYMKYNISEILVKWILFYLNIILKNAELLTTDLFEDWNTPWFNSLIINADQNNDKVSWFNQILKNYVIVISNHKTII